MIVLAQVESAIAEACRLAVAHLTHMCASAVAQGAWVRVDALLAVGIQYQSIGTRATGAALRVLTAVRASAITRFAFILIDAIEVR